MVDLCCPECGDIEFHQDRAELNRYSVTIQGTDSGPWFEDTGDFECLDSERDAPIYCNGCGWEVDDELLLTTDQYEAVNAF